MTSSPCLEEGSGLKHFPLTSSPFYLNKSLFNSFDDVFLSLTTEKRKVPSAKSLRFDDKPVDKSLE